MTTPLFDEISKKIELDESLIQHDLSIFYARVKEHRNSFQTICKEWGSAEHFVNVLYWMKFVKKFNPTQMKTIIGKKTLPRIYRELGWGFNTNEFEECNKKYDEYLMELNRIKDSFQIDDGIYLSQEFLEKTKDSRGVVNKKLLPYYKVKTEEELIRRLYYYYYVCELSAHDISRIYGFSERAIEKLLVQLNLNLSASESQKRAAKKRDYGQIEITRRHTMASTLTYDGMFGSHVENTVRTLLATKIERTFAAKYEIIVGLNTRTIIPPREIDIPVLMIRKSDNTVFKIAIEVDGEIYHSSEVNQKRDCEKDAIISEHGWEIIRINIPIGMRTDNTTGEAINRTLDGVIGIINERIIKDKDAKENVYGENEKCPQCSGRLIKRTATRGQYAGNTFWGCSNYPRCKYIKNE